MQFVCPLDGAALTADGAMLKCPAGHSFDRAKEGYYNLLLVQQKATLDPGDNKEMVEARRRFLEAGHFAPIAARLAALVRDVAGGNPRILDAGCGEGYYLGRVLGEVPGASAAGIDISKWAVRAAAKSYKNVAWAVASSKRLPVAEKSQDLILCLFGFPFWESFRTALASGGHVLLVDPGPQHLLELREQIYEEVRSTQVASIDGALAAGFRVVREETLDFSISLAANAAIQDLLAMTPHGYRISAAARERLAGLGSLSTRVSVVFRLLKAE